MSALQFKTNRYGVGPYLAQTLPIIWHTWVSHFCFFLETLFLASKAPPSPDFPSTTLAVHIQFPFLFPSSVFQTLKTLTAMSILTTLKSLHATPDFSKPLISTST